MEQRHAEGLFRSEIEYFLSKYVQITKHPMQCERSERSNMSICSSAAGSSESRLRESPFRQILWTIDAIRRPSRLPSS